MDKDLDLLIAQLRTLWIRHTQILQQLELTMAQEGQVICHIETWREQQVLPPAPQQPLAADTICAAIFEPGDCIYICNKVRRRRGHPLVNKDDQRSAVTLVEGDKVSITTDKGFATWRLSKHLCFPE